MWDMGFVLTSRLKIELELLEYYLRATTGVDLPVVEISFCCSFRFQKYVYIIKMVVFVNVWRRLINLNSLKSL